ncbi:MAG: flagellin [Myxococcota bacterium]
MGLTVNTNMASLGAISNLNNVQGNLQKSLARISSGMRITRAGDDAAGLGVAENLSAANRSLKMAMRNTNDGISVVQTAEGAAGEIGNILKRMRELAVQSASETLENQERTYVNDEFAALASEIDRIAEVTEFNGVPLGNAAAAALANLQVQVGIDGSANSRIAIALSNLRSDSANMAVDTGSIDLLTAGNAQTAIGGIDSAIDFINTVRSGYGATQNRLEAALRQTDNYFLNLKDSESRIRDTDFAFESAELSKYQIMQQSGVAVLAQAKGIFAQAAQLIQ